MIKKWIGVTLTHAKMVAVAQHRERKQNVFVLMVSLETGVKTRETDVTANPVRMVASVLQEQMPINVDAQ